MKCMDCDSNIYIKNPSCCPYCGSRNIASKEEAKKKQLKNIDNFERAGRYEDAAKLCEKLELWDRAGEIRRKGKTRYIVNANISIGRVGSISMECPHCGASQPIASKSNEVSCAYCKKVYAIPKNVLELL